MRFRVPLVIMGSIFAAGIAAVACYRDDIPGPPRGKPLARVLLTDAPFPFDSVASVNLYVVSVEAATTPDTGSRATWTTVAEPHRTFNLLAVQQGATAFVGEGERHRRSRRRSLRLRRHPRAGGLGRGAMDTLRMGATSVLSG